MVGKTLKVYNIMTRNEQSISWLNSAYAMEWSMAEVLENHAKDAADHPAMSARISEHLEETKEHALQVEKCFALLGEKPPAMKSAMSTMMGKVQGVSTGIFHHELIKTFWRIIRRSISRSRVTNR
jgi:ferritin-like metal-binding protein YciE